MGIVTDVRPSARGVPLLVDPDRSGMVGEAGKVTILTIGDNASVPPPTNFAVNVQNQLIELRWTASDAPDVDYYEIRYAPDPVYGVWSHSQFLARMPWDVLKTSVGARTGRYFIQAVDTSGNRSEVVSKRTTVEHLPDLNIVDKINDRLTGWQGAKQNTVAAAGGIQLAGDFGSVVPEGFYEFQDILAFSEPFEIRVSSKIIAYGVLLDDMMFRWVPIAIARPLARGSSLPITAELQYRTSDDIGVLTAPPVKNRAPYSGSGLWSEWRSITVSDVTARFVQFRVRLTTPDPYLKVVLSDALVEIDSIDRIYRQFDISATTAGATVNYDPPFMGKPVVAISIDGSETAIDYKVTNQTKAGCRVTLYDSSGNPVAGTFDISALGQGKQRTISI